MLAKDSVRSRLDSDAGISFTEFAYQVGDSDPNTATHLMPWQVFQANDFLQLYEQHNCVVQVCMFFFVGVVPRSRFPDRWL